MPKDPNEVGAIWEKKSQRGTPYLSVNVKLERLIELNGGVVGDVDLVAFTIDEKSKTTSPDYRLKFFPRDGAARPVAVATRPTPPPAQAPLLDDDIPF